MAKTHRVFITGSTGYIGTRLIPELLAQAHQVIALARDQARHKLPANCTPAIADALNGDSYRSFAEGANTFIQLVGSFAPKSRQGCAIPRNRRRGRSCSDQGRT